MGPCVLGMVLQLRMTLSSIVSVIPVEQTFVLRSPVSMVRTSDASVQNQRAEHMVITTGHVCIQCLCRCGSRCFDCRLHVYSTRARADPYTYAKKVSEKSQSCGCRSLVLPVPRCFYTASQYLRSTVASGLPFLPFCLPSWCVFCNNSATFFLSFLISHLR